jgi:hypothetical protein
MSILRSIWSVFIGLLAGGLVIGVLQLLGMLFFPLPVTMERFNAMTTDEKRELLHAAPAMVFVHVLVGYALGMLVAGMVRRSSGCDADWVEPLPWACYSRW